MYLRLIPPCKSCGTKARALVVAQMHNYFPLKILHWAFVDEFHTLYKLDTKGDQMKLQTLALQDKHVQKPQRIKNNSWTKC